MLTDDNARSKSRKYEFKIEIKEPTLAATPGVVYQYQPPELKETEPIAKGVELERPSFDCEAFS